MKINKGLIASIIVIFISILAFAAGFFKEGVVSKIEETKVEISDSEILVERMDSKISDILIYDQLRIQEALDEKVHAQKLIMKFNTTFSLLDTEEKIALLNETLFSLVLYNQLIKSSYIGNMFSHWYITNSTANYYFATVVVDGYSFNISKEEFEDYSLSKPIMRFQARVDFLLDFVFPKTIIDFATINNQYLPTNFVVLESWKNWNEFLKINLFEIQQEIAENSAYLSELESQDSFYSYGVTIITVATILSTAMASKISDNTSELEFYDFKNKLYTKHEIKDDSEPPARNRYAIPVLIIALIFAALGLLFPILYRLIF